MQFEFDPEKSAANLAKHGIDFEAAQALWDDQDLIIMTAESGTEPRFAVVGLLDDRHWTAFATMRGNRIRIISVRRARDKEARAYDEKGNQR
jgi:uncharacterized protein